MWYICYYCTDRQNHNDRSFKEGSTLVNGQAKRSQLGKTVLNIFVHIALNPDREVFWADCVNNSWIISLQTYGATISNYFASWLKIRKYPHPVEASIYTVIAVLRTIININAPGFNSQSETKGLTDFPKKAKLCGTHVFAHVSNRSCTQLSCQRCNSPDSDKLSRCLQLKTLLDQHTSSKDVDRRPEIWLAEDVSDDLFSKSLKTRLMSSDSEACTTTRLITCKPEALSPSRYFHAIIRTQPSNKDHDLISRSWSPPDLAKLGQHQSVKPLVLHQRGGGLPNQLHLLWHCFNRSA